MSGRIILSKPHDEVLGEIGLALLRVKNARKLTLDELGKVLGRERQMVAQYIAGEGEMGVIAWLRATDEWPELADKLAEAEGQS